MCTHYSITRDFKKSNPHGIKRHVLTRANPFVEDGIHALLKHGFVTLIMSYQGHRINPPSIVLDSFFLKRVQVYVIVKEACRYWWGCLS